MSPTLCCPARLTLVLVTLLTVLAVVAGCRGGDPVTRRTPTPTSTLAPSSVPVTPQGDPSELAQQKAAAKIEDCPASTDAAPVTGGLPDLTVSCLGGGRPVRLAGLRGEPTVINLWAQWCEPCRAEAPFLAEVSGQTRGRVSFLGVDYLDPSPGRAIEFARVAGWTYPQVVDPEAALQVPLRIPSGIPITVFVRADGTVAHTAFGPVRSADELRGLISTHLGVRA